MSQLVNQLKTFAIQGATISSLTVMKTLHLTPGTGSVMVASDVLIANGPKEFRSYAQWLTVSPNTATTNY